MPPEIKRLSFSKAEKLCSKRIIEAIYSRGKKIRRFPFILNYLEVGDDLPMDYPIQIVVAVPKRKVKKAASRNRLKRQIKEAYRLNKSTLTEQVYDTNKKLALFLIYIGKETENYTFIEKQLTAILEEIKLKI